VVGIDADHPAGTGREQVRRAVTGAATQVQHLAPGGEAGEELVDREVGLEEVVGYFRRNRLRPHPETGPPPPQGIAAAAPEPGRCPHGHPMAAFRIRHWQDVRGFRVAPGPGRRTVEWIVILGGTGESRDGS
jgi:hypothetical protein